MNHYANYLFIFTMFLLSACSQFETRKEMDALLMSGDLAIAKLGLSESTKAKELTPKQIKEVEKDLEGLIAYCKPVLTGLENDAKSSAKKAFYLSMLGLIAGAVIAPALTAANASANATWIAATSGFSGATNTASVALRASGLSGTADATTRRDIINRLREKLTVIVDPNKTIGEIHIALLSARAECVLYDIAVPAIPTTQSGG